MLLLLACTDAPPRALSRPNRVAVGPEGTVFVSDFQHDRIVEFDADGGFLRTMGSSGVGRGDLWRVTALAVTRAGELWAVNQRPTGAGADGSRHELVRFADGRELGRTPLPEGTSVDAIAETPDGTVVIADSTHGALIEVGTDGSVIGRYGPESRDGAPSALALDGDTLWVVEQRNQRVAQIDRERERLRLSWARGEGDGPSFPSAAAPCGRFVVVADYGRHRIVRVDRAGRVVHSVVPEPESVDQPVQLMDLRADARCERLYAVDSKGDRVLVMDFNGLVLHELWAW